MTDDPEQLRKTIEQLKQKCRTLRGRLNDPSVHKRKIKLLKNKTKLLRGIVNVSIDGVPLVFHAPHRRILRRVESIENKEPGTIQWISTFRRGDVFVDVGANIGIFSVLAAKLRKAIVHCFEPVGENFSVLNEHIRLNNCSDLVVAWPIALLDRSEFSLVYISEGGPGSAGNSFGRPVDNNLQTSSFEHKQGSVATTLDQLVADSVIPFPSHIKIDVDGFEHRVLEGAKRTITSERMRSILVELNLDLTEHRRLIKEIESCGLRLDRDELDKMRMDRKGTSIYNHIFLR